MQKGGYSERPVRFFNCWLQSIKGNSYHETCFSRLESQQLQPRMKTHQDIHIVCTSIEIVKNKSEIPHAVFYRYSHTEVQPFQLYRKHSSSHHCSQAQHENKTETLDWCRLQGNRWLHKCHRTPIYCVTWRKKNNKIFTLLQIWRNIT